MAIDADSGGAGAGRLFGSVRELVARVIVGGLVLIVVGLVVLLVIPAMVLFVVYAIVRTALSSIGASIGSPASSGIPAADGEGRENVRVRRGE